MKRAKIDHLDRRGFRVTDSALANSKGERRNDIEIVGRRSRKEWGCAADDCALNGHIDLDEVYVEVAEGVSRFNGRTRRFHMPCALRHNLIEKRDDAVDKTNNRRAAIAMTKAKREAAGC